MNKGDFDKVINKDNGVTYGIIKGSNKVFYIKTGNGGSIYGYNNKYLNMALTFNKNYQFTIIVASNPINVKEEENIKNDLEFIKTLVDCSEIYAFGHSNGGVMLCCYAYKYKNIKQVISVNAPLNINLHKLKNGISNFNSDQIICVYGTNDISYRYLPLLYSIKKDNFKIVEIKGVDHNFTNKLDEFIQLSLLFKKL